MEFSQETQAAWKAYDEIKAKLESRVTELESENKNLKEVSRQRDSYIAFLEEITGEDD